MADKRPAPEQTDPALPLEHEELHPILRFLSDNLKPIALGVGGLLLVVALVSGYRAWSASRLAESRAELSALAAANDEDRLANLAAFAKQAPEALRAAALYELAKAAAEADDQAAALEAFRSLGSTKDPAVRAVAELGAARVLMAMGEPAQAAQSLKAAAPSAPQAYKPALTRALAVAAEAAGQWDEARTAYEELSELEPGDPLISAKLNELQAKQGQAAPATPAS